MRRILWLAIILFLLIPQAVASGNSSKSSILAEFTNGGFETNPSDPGSGWHWSNNNWTWDGSVAHSGTHSASVFRTGGSETGSVYSEYLLVQSSTIYTLNYWLRTDSATWYPRVVVNQYTSSGSQTGPYLVAYPNIGSGTNGWELISYQFQTLPNASQIQIRLYLYTDTTGTFWFDDFGLVENGPALYPYHVGFPVLASGSDWLSSPTVADINHDGNNELLIGAGSAVNGWDRTGAPLHGFPLETGDRSIVGQIGLADLNNDGRLEIMAGTRSVTSEGQCRVFVWNDTGALLPGWPQSVAWETQYSGNSCWITSIVASDINGDHNLELVASTTNNGELDPYAPIVAPSLYAWHLDGTLVSGNWPNAHYNVGVYGAVAVGDINGDGAADVVVGRDYLWLNVYGSDGQSLPGWPIATYVGHNGGNYDTEQRIEYSVNAPIIADLDGDNNPEIIVAGHVKGPGNIEDKLNSGLLVLNADGTRRPGWETAAVGNGILAQVDLPWQGPVVADLNGDGMLEIVVATEDGWIRAYKADKTLLWEFNYTQGATLFATDPVIGDVNGDGNLEIVFGTYVPLLSESDKDGPVGLWALTSSGDVVSGFPMVIPTPGIRSTPTLADMDGNGRLEILATTRSGQVLVWDTQTAYQPDRLPWPTGRHDVQRTGSFIELSSVTLTINQSTGGTITAYPTGPYHLNDPVTLIATPDTGWSFSSWTGDCVGRGNPCNLIMNSNKTVSAIFTTNTYTSTPTRTADFTPTRTSTYTATPTRTATSTPVPTNTNTATPTRTATFTPVPTNTNMATPTRTATYTLAPTNTNTSTPTRTTSSTPVPTNTSTPTRTATFTELPIVTLTINPSTGGTITASPNGPYHLNDIVTLTAAAQQGYNFFYWLGDTSGTANPTTITLNGNKTVGAYFQQGMLRESFDTLTSWTAKGGGTMTLDTLNYRQGIASIKLTMPVRNGYVNITKTVNWDLSVSQGDLKFWLYVSSTGSPTSFQILLSNNSAMKDYYLASVPVKSGWNLINLSTTGWIKYGKASWPQPFVRVQFQGLGNGGLFYLVDGLTTGDVTHPGVPFIPGMGIFLPIISR